MRQWLAHGSQSWACGSSRSDGTCEKDNCKLNRPWLAFTDDVKEVIVESGVTEIQRNAFIDFPNIQKVVLPGTLTLIGPAAFSGCTALKEVEFKQDPAELKIGMYAFANTGFEDLEIPAYVTSIGDSAFWDSKELKSLTFAEGSKLKTIEKNAFTKCPNLKEIVFPDEVDTIGNVAFSAKVSDTDTTAPALEKVTFGAKIPSCGVFQFYRQSKLTTVDLSKCASIPTLTNQEFKESQSEKITFYFDNEAAMTTFKACTGAYESAKAIFVVLNGGSVPKDAGYYEDSGKLITPEKTGQKFAAWYTDADFTTEATTAAVGSTYYAKWQDRALDHVTVAPKADAKFTYGGALTPADFVVTEVYDNGETVVVDQASYTVSPEKLETVGSVNVTVTYGEDTYTCTIDVAKATQPAPDAPELADRTYTSITLKTVEGAEYKCGDGKWQTTPEFTDLTAGTTYTFQIRYAETDTHAASDPSEAAEFATLTQSSSGGGGGSSRNNSYAISTPKADNGTVTINNGSTAKKGDTVTITVKPDEGYEIDKVTVTDSKGNSITVTDKGDGKFSFVMPDSKVDVKATFVKSEVKPDQPSKTAFVDVPENSWYADAADFVAQRGLMSGVGENLFGGGQNTTRAMLMTILARMDGQDVTGGATWYEKAMNWAKQTGVSDGTMPEVNITREQLATMLYSYAKLKGVDTTQGGMAVREFNDYDSISAWANQSMAWAVNAGILSGRGNNTLAPTAGATRAEMAVMLQQFVGLMEK